MVGRTVSHYHVLEKLGKGGMGVVYKARDTRLERVVALKFLPPERVTDPERKRRFVREARAASALNHPNIITVYDIDQADGADFIAMECVSGRTLSQVIAGKPLPVKDALGYAVQIADALIAAHRAGIIHRDLKPGNVMVTEDGRAKVLDFGLAKLTEVTAESTLTLVVGTAAYMAPEQAEGQAADARSDIYSFGALLYEMLAGRRAFTGMAREEPAPLTGVSPELQQIVARCLRRNPAERFQTAGELKAALEKTGLEAHPTLPSIAVLPFANLSADKENEYFSDGLAEEIINALTKVPGLRVPARTSSFAFRGKEMDVSEIGAKLKVGHILEGSVRKAGDRIRVTSQLINVADGYHLWSERYDRRLADIFDVQDEIARAIVDKLRVQLVGDRPLIKRPTENLEAYSLYLKGRYHMAATWVESYTKIKESLELAIKLDPHYALAYAGLAYYYCWAPTFGLSAPKKSFSAATRAALDALALDDTIAEAHMVLGMIAAFHFDWLRAESEFQRALELNPASSDCHDSYAFAFLGPMGRLQDAAAEFERALELDPLSLIVQCHQGFLSYWRRDYHLAIRQCRRVLELSPNYTLAHFCIGLAAMEAGLFDEAARAVETVLALGGRNALVLALLGLVYARSGRVSEARELLEELVGLAGLSYVSPAQAGWIYLGLEETDKAFESFEKAFEDDSAHMLYLRIFPIYDPIRPDPRYRALLRKMNLA